MEVREFSDLEALQPAMMACLSNADILVFDHILISM